jgi:hypothetical protein
MQKIQLDRFIIFTLCKMLVFIAPAPASLRLDATPSQRFAGDGGNIAR